MDHFAGLDVSVKETSVCIVDDTGKIVREVKVASEPKALLSVLKNPAYRFKRIGLEAGPLSQWLFSALAEAELPVVCVETRHMQAVRCLKCLVGDFVDIFVATSVYFSFNVSDGLGSPRSMWHTVSRHLLKASTCSCGMPARDSLSGIGSSWLQCDCHTSLSRSCNRRSKSRQSSPSSRSFIMTLVFSESPGPAAISCSVGCLC